MSIESLKEDVLQETEAFGKKLGSVVRKFIRDTRTSKDQIRAIIRCMRKCIDNLNNIGKLVVEDGIAQPEANDSEELGNDQLRSNARRLLKFFKNHTLESFLTALYPEAKAGSEVMVALATIQSAVLESDSLIDRVINEGYDCLSTSEDGNEEDDENDNEDNEA